MLKHGLKSLLALFCVLTFIQCNFEDANTPRDPAIAKLKLAARSNNFWVKVHAYEFLQKLGHKDWIDSNFNTFLVNHENIPKERIGVWRIGSQIARLNANENPFLDKIKSVYIDTSSTDRLHAAESLAKLEYSITYAPEELILADIQKGSLISDFVQWGKCIPTKIDGQFGYGGLLKSIKNSTLDSEKEILAYALTKSHYPIQENEVLELEELAKNPNFNKLTQSRLQIAFYLKSKHHLDKKKRQQLNFTILQLLKSNIKAVRYETCEALALTGVPSDIAELTNILNGESTIESNNSSTSEIADLNMDCQSAAAFAVHSIIDRDNDKLSDIDWIVIIGFLVLMIWIGYYYSRKTESKDDYLLGGRSMNPYMVGISLFATLLSTLSYLAYPGEMIKYGPTVFFGILAFPVAYFIVGKYLIPQFMKLKVTSAYEILEVKLGSEVRDLATAFFLLLRFLWMSTIVYATVNTALISILGFDQSYVPVVCLILALITVLYTVLGGIKAVVLTDVIQSGVLMVGAILTIIIIFSDFNYSIQWLPSELLNHWAPLNFSIDFNQRMTVGNIFIMTLVWQICTTGSDQMAIQRYLSTSNVKNAKASLKISLISSGLVQIILAILGLAVMAYFIKYPNLMEYGTDIYKNADMLFPRFILVGLPVGITGLVVAGIMAAAMSSLSSGLNSSSTVIVEDIIDRHFPSVFPSIDSLKKIKIISVILGIIVTMSSMAVGFIEGNLLDIIIKLVNLFVAPLFVLFFMALFVSKATNKGVFYGGLFSLLIAILIAFYNLFDLSILTIMPISLIVGIGASWMFSLLDRFISK